MKKVKTDDEVSRLEDDSARAGASDINALDDNSIECAPDDLKPKKRRRWLWVLAISLAAVLVVAGGISASFFVMRARGEKNLKTVVSVPHKKSGTQAVAKKNGNTILYNGKEYRYKEDIINILCMGIDKDIPMDMKRDTGSMGLVDAILLLSLDTKAHTMKLIAIPRDTITDIRILDTKGHDAGIERKQLAYQYAYGYTAQQSCDLTRDAVSEVLHQIPIQRYCSINFEAIPAMNDAIGGVDVTVLEDMTWYNWEFSKGNAVHLTGDMALDYVRQRDEYVTGSNLGRIERQKQYISAFLEKAKTVMHGDLTIPLTLYQQLQGNMCTDIKAEDITYLVPEMLKMSLTPEDMFMLPGDVVQGEEHEEYHLQDDAVKEMVINTFYEEVQNEEK